LTGLITKKKSTTATITKASRASMKSRNSLSLIVKLSAEKSGLAAARAERRRVEVLEERRHECGERGPDHDRHREVHEVAAHDELAEVLEHGAAFQLSVPGPSAYARRRD